MVSALVTVAVSLSVGVENSQKLYEVQRTKSSRQKSSQQLDRIQKKLTEVRLNVGLCFFLFELVFFNDFGF